MAVESEFQALPDGIRLDALKAQAKAPLQAVQASESDVLKRIERASTRLVANAEAGKLVLARNRPSTVGAS